MHPLHLSIRIDPANEDHHLGDNNGTWWCHYTLHRGERRVRHLTIELAGLRTSQRPSARPVQSIAR